MACRHGSTPLTCAHFAAVEMTTSSPARSAAFADLRTFGSSSQRLVVRVAVAAVQPADRQLRVLLGEPEHQVVDLRVGLRDDHQRAPGGGQFAARRGRRASTCRHRAASRRRHRASVPCSVSRRIASVARAAAAPGSKEAVAVTARPPSVTGSGSGTALRSPGGPPCVHGVSSGSGQLRRRRAGRARRGCKQTRSPFSRHRPRLRLLAAAHLVHDPQHQSPAVRPPRRHAARTRAVCGFPSSERYTFARSPRCGRSSVAHGDQRARARAACPRCHAITTSVTSPANASPGQPPPRHHQRVVQGLLGVEPGLLTLARGQLVARRSPRRRGAAAGARPPRPGPGGR